MPVYDEAGEMVGTVDAESLEHDYLTMRQGTMFPHDRYLPQQAIARVEPDGVYLKLSRRALRAKRYATPPRAEQGAAITSATAGAPAGLASTEAEAPAETAAASAAAGAEQLSRVSVPLAAEELVARRTPVQAGTVRLHKSVETEEQAAAIALTHEEVIVEHIPPDQIDAHGAVGANELLIPIMEEQVVVQKRMVVKEYIRVRKRQVVEQRQVREPVRREVLSVQQMPAEESGQPAWPLAREVRGPMADEMPGADVNANA